MTGRTIAHYEVLEKLGEGGMGVVYKARDTHLDRFVAIKTLPPERTADPERKRRFIQEAKAASALNHPNIITIHDIDQADGIDFIAMEYVAGKTLRELLPRRGMRLSEALKIAAQISDALARAHGAGIIHRDLKPANIMVDEHGVAKVLDFGLAKLTEKAEENEAASTATADAAQAFTEKGAILGTVAYMSPEQAEGRLVDARSDIFSFGSVLYEMITGHRAFQGDSKVSTLAAILNREPEPIGLDVPPELQKVIARCLRKGPDRRFQTMSDLKVQLIELKEDSDSSRMTAVPLSARRRIRKWILPAAAITALATVSAVLWQLMSRREVPEPVLNAIPFTSYPGQEMFPTISPDGSQAAFSWSGEKQNNLDIYVKLAGTDPLRLTTDPAPDVSPAWSPDGRWIAFVRYEGAMKEGIFVILQSGIGAPKNRILELNSDVKCCLGGAKAPKFTYRPLCSEFFYVLSLVDSSSPEFQRSNRALFPSSSVFSSPLSFFFFC